MPSKRQALWWICCVVTTSMWFMGEMTFKPMDYIALLLLIGSAFFLGSWVEERYWTSER